MVKLNLSQSSFTAVDSSRQRAADSPSVRVVGELVPTLPAPPPSDDGSDSPAPGARLSMVGATSRPFGTKLRQAVWLLSEEFSNTSTLLRGFYEAELNKEMATALTLEALTQRCKLPASARNVSKNVSGPIQFFLDAMGESNPTGVTLTGDASVAPLRDYLESAAERVRTVPGAVKTSLSTWSDSIWIS